MASSQTSISQYLLLRLKELSVDHVFGIPGDYVLPFFDKLLDGDHGVEHVMSCNELNGTYAADGYAKQRGFGAMAVTFGPGSLSCINAVAGAYADDVPLLVVAGAPSVRAMETSKGRLLHHAVGEDLDANIKCFAPVTVSSSRLASCEGAGAAIDAVLTQCVLRKKPAYLEIPYDLQTALIAKPAGKLQTCAASSRERLRAAVDAVAALVEKAGTTAVLAGHLALRHGQTEPLCELAERLGACTASTFGCKHGSFETGARAAGVYCGAMSLKVAQKAVEGEGASHVLLAVGLTNNEFDTGVFTGRLDLHNLVVVAGMHVEVNGERFEEVAMGDFLGGLLQATEVVAMTPRLAACPRFYYPRGEVVPTEEALSIDRMMMMFAAFFKKGDVIYGDAGGMINTSQVQLPEGCVAYGNGNWASIGAGFGGLVGGSFARGEGRLIGMLGDGAFQMSAQELSTLVKYKRDAALFVLNNAGYAAERAIHPGKQRSYNDVQNWRYHLLGNAFGAEAGYEGVEVFTERDLAKVLTGLQEVRGVTMVNVHLDPEDFAAFNKDFSEKLKH